MYLIKLGFGRCGRFAGFQDVGVDKASFELAKTLAEEWEDDELDTIYPEAVLLRALCLKAEWDHVDLSMWKDHPETLSAMQSWNIKAVEAPYEDVYVIMIWNTNT